MAYFKVPFENELKQLKSNKPKKKLMKIVFFVTDCKIFNF